MNREDAIKLAAAALPPSDHVPWDSWAQSVVRGADALLAAMGEQPRACDGAGMNWRCSEIVRYVGDFVVNLDGTKHTCALPNDDANPDPVEYCDETCCAATEERVVREIVWWLRAHKLACVHIEGVERGDWRAKEPVR